MIIQSDSGIKITSYCDVSVGGLLAMVVKGRQRCADFKNFGPFAIPLTDLHTCHIFTVGMHKNPRQQNEQIFMLMFCN